MASLCGRKCGRSTSCSRCAILRLFFFEVTPTWVSTGSSWRTTGTTTSTMPTPSSSPYPSPCRPFFFTWITSTMQRLGFARTNYVVLALGVVWNGVALVPWLPVQVVAFTAFTFQRAFFFSEFYTYMAHTFGSVSCGRVVGLCTVLAAALNLLVWPAVALTDEHLQGELRYFFGGLLVLCAPLAVVFVVFERHVRACPAREIPRAAAQAG
mmetsp:Transcript_30496/g.78886  ORF Transcript_30496/g.78886 Transcript_30496/m.78886 type:complete len:210 (+) Transcript_30496:182-811(+)